MPPKPMLFLTMFLHLLLLPHLLLPPLLISLLRRNYQLLSWNS